MNRYKRYVELDKREREVYNGVFNSGKAVFDSLLASGTILKNYAFILEIFLRLRQICDHTALYHSSTTLKTTPSVTSATGAVPFKNTVASVDEAQIVFDILQDTAEDQCNGCNVDFSCSNQDFTPLPFLTICEHLFCHLCSQKLFKSHQADVRHGSGGACAVCQTSLQHSDLFRVKSSLEMESTASNNASADPAMSNFMKVSSSESETSLSLAQAPSAVLFDAAAVTQTIPTTNNDNDDATLHSLDDKLIPSSKTKALISDLLRIQSEEVHLHLKKDPNATPTKSVVFSQWTRFLSLLARHLSDVKISYARLEGSMTLARRQQELHRFKHDPSISVLLVSLRAGGVGLNLNYARRVYLMDPWWWVLLSFTLTSILSRNPSVENQAIDRIYRLGQTHPVETIRMVVKDSIEENIIQLQKRKTELARMALSEDSEERRGREHKKEKIQLSDLKFIFKDADS